MADAADCQMPSPTPHHAKLLEQVGTWEVATKHFMEPGKPPMEGKAVDHVTAVGGFWTVSRFETTMFGQPFVGHATLGYRPEAGKYVMTWVDSMSPFLFVMEGDFDASGTVLTLTGKGPSMAGPELTDWKSVMVCESPNRQILRMSMMTPMGEFQFMENTYTRQK